MEYSRVYCVLFDGANNDVTFSPGTEMPVLSSFVKDGIFVHAKTVLPSDSQCARHAAFSGSYPSVSGILTNNPAETVFDVAKEYDLKTIVSGGWEGDRYSINNSGAVTLFNAPSADSVNDMYLVKGKKGETTSRQVVNVVSSFIEKNPDFKICFIDFLDSDSVGHRYKETSDEYRRSLEYEDKELKRFLTKVKQLELYEGSLWIIFTDHSILDGSHGDHQTLESWIILNGDVLEERYRGTETVGTILDICPTICAALGIREPRRCRAVSFFDRVHDF